MTAPTDDSTTSAANRRRIAVNGGENPRPEVGAEPLIVDDREKGRFRVNRRTMVDPDVLALERTRVFDRCWLYVGHDSELAPAPRLPGPDRRRPTADLHPQRRRSRAGVHQLLHPPRHAAVPGEGRQRPLPALLLPRLDLRHVRQAGRPARRGAPTGRASTATSWAWPPRRGSSPTGASGSSATTPTSSTCAPTSATPRRSSTCSSTRASTTATARSSAAPTSTPCGPTGSCSVENSFDGYHAMPTHQRYMEMVQASGVDLASRFAPAHRRPAPLVGPGAGQRPRDGRRHGRAGPRPATGRAREIDAARRASLRRAVRRGQGRPR